MQYGYIKNAEFDADFEFVEKVSKKSCNKIYQQQNYRKM